MSGCGCGTNHNDGRSVVERVRQKGISNNLMDQAYELRCSCGEVFTMKTFEAKCPACGMVYGVTPCSQDDANNIKEAGINF